ncbi:hypothetical protein RD110_08185 [Rhodoferax koreense]|uniref:PHB depolymerase esterase n=1 Tax=Rhodoferax koreensis TaxID=1842727 RepID=A0A1P8K3G2_9BURK|nr:PHB depolymerase family esterase [Rhodoferax koreense]APW40549.1 hypothetical protein RD110_08185 [Rhodoferax koreense]
MHSSIHDLMRAASRLTQGGDLQQATENIQRALRQAGLSNPGFSPPGMPVAPPTTQGTVLDGYVFEVGAAKPTSAKTDAASADFVSGTHSHAGRSLAYKLYVPPGYEGQSLPLVVMLHGCTQNPDDFAAGTGINELAREQGFYVLYPAQAQDANPSRCWNWFKHNHQGRGNGEPGVISNLTQAIVRSHGIDPSRVYVAGLSAGGAMAAILAEAYPEIFAAAGVHSGLPPGAARDMPGAFSVMKTGVSPAGAARANGASGAAVPTIVFHGDRDDTVHPLNGQQVVTKALGDDAAPASQRQEQGRAPNGRRFTRTVHTAADGRVLAEHWLIHGAGHAWSGGRPQGSYTDGTGPDATREMMRFFAGHRRPDARA